MSFLITLCIATVLGTLAGLGLGGGSLLIVYVTAVLGMSTMQARGLNLLFFLPASLIATVLRRRNLSLKKIMPAAIAGILCAILFSHISTRLDTALLQKLFGVLLLFTGVRELFYRERNCK